MPSQVGSEQIRVRASAVSALLVVWLMGCAATGPPRPHTGYRADVTVKIIDSSGESAAPARLVEFYYMGKRRRETRVDGEVVALIDRPDLRISWMLNPAQNSFEEYRISSLDAVINSAPNPFGPRFNASFESLGAENIEGVDTQKYAVKGNEISGFAWFTTDRIPFRFSGTLGSKESSVELEIAYAGIRRGSQAAYRFAVPPTYAGYDNRKMKRSRSSTEIDDAARRLREEQIGRDGPDPRGLVPPPNPF